ncbi:ankyrin repeat domain-containing protein [Pseudoalteromonas sp. OFAV1]|jgi:hypothetical protein|uniref:ankyrin repeat domain-containing protein n=1 Tax=Pseudoalteromonas sp. OFAV1 TaxID=2908892 RepID=UPI001F47EEDC|nr:ankyrin repeat domain-containing protein [Pseudoalteromonas sp. OFAV1]MCF2900949.1 ankyrin repeat domain-containing protein [Pseudoalteromonas sp. OFAV1]
MLGDSKFNLVANAAHRLAVDDVYLNLKESYPDDLIPTDIGTGDSVLHRLAKDDVDPDIFLRLLEYSEMGNLETHTNTKGETVLDILIKKHMQNHLTLLSKENIISLAEYKSKSYNALHIAAKKDNPKFMKFLLFQGVNANEKDIRGNTPLHVARRYACHLNADIIEQYSLDKDVLKPKKKDNENQTEGLTP